MRKIAGLFLALPLWASFSTPTLSTPSCSSNPCTVSITSTGAGHGLLVWLMSPNAGVSITSASDNAGDTLYHPAGGGGQATASCQASDSSAGSVDCALIYSVSGGATSVTLNFSGSPGSATVRVYELPYTNGPIGYELPYAVDDSSSGTSQSAPTLNLRQSNDIIFQVAQCSQSISNITGGYTRSGSSAYLLNTTSGAAPTWTLSSGGTCAVAAIAFGEQYGVVSGLNTEWIAFNRGGYSSASNACLVPGNLAVSSGQLVGITKSQSASCDSIDLAEASAPNTSWEVAMRNFSFTYGTVTIVVQNFGGASGDNIWPGLELYDATCQMSDPTGTDNNCVGREVDFAEVLGNVTQVNNQIHFGSGGQCLPNVSNVTQNQHTYSLIWSSSSYVFQVDGTTTCTINDVSTTPAYLKMLMFAGYLNDTPGGLPWTTHINSVTVTQNGTTVFEDCFSGCSVPPPPPPPTVAPPTSPGIILR
jgi:Glycosyl hydrolases family 16